MSVALLEGVSSVAAYYLPSNSSPSLVQGVITKLGSGRAADVTQASQAMAPAGATVEGGCIRVSTSDPALAVFLALQGGPLLGGGTTAWTNLGQVADAPWADAAASRSPPSVLSPLHRPRPAHLLCFPCNKMHQSKLKIFSYTTCINPS